MVSEANQKAIEGAGLSFILGMRIPHVPYAVSQWRREHPGDQIPDLYTPVMRHLTLVMAALAICAVTAASLRETSPAPQLPTRADQEPPQDPGLIPFTVPEIKRLYILFHQALHSITHELGWSRWRRRHQARARWYHHRTRLRDLAT